MENLNDYLNKKIVSRMVRRGDFAALNMTKGDATIYATDAGFARAHGLSRQSLRSLCNGGAVIDASGNVFSGNRRSLSFVIKKYGEKNAD